MPDIIFDTPFKSVYNYSWCHLSAETLDVLHEFADKIGLKTEWFQDKPGLPHYDIKSDEIREKALSLGARQVERKDFFSIVKNWYTNINNEKAVQDAVSVLFYNHKFLLTNSYVFAWESDFFSVTKGGNVYEVEVKVSRSDYFADFAKDKHKLFMASRDCVFITRFPEERTNYTEGNQYVEDQKYISAPYCKVKWQDPETFVIPNRFYYAVPKGLIKVEELPSYAGLIELDPACGYAGITKAAPFLHKRSLFTSRFYSILLDKFWYLSQNQRYTINSLQYKIKQNGKRYANT